jgi:uncharacterized membrane protein YphA (DoxX/SURF4 family)
MPTLIGFRGGVMAVHEPRTLSASLHRRGGPHPGERGWRHDPGHQAFLVLRTAFTVAPVLFGLDKFTNLMTSWPRYLAHWIDALVPGTAQQAMYAVGVVEVVAGLVVLIAPRFGAWLVAAWLAGIVVDLVTGPGFYDIALRDVGLLLAAVALGRLASRYAPGRQR